MALSWKWYKILFLCFSAFIAKSQSLYSGGNVCRNFNWKTTQLPWSLLVFHLLPSVLLFFLSSFCATPNPLAGLGGAVSSPAALPKDKFLCLSGVKWYIKQQQFWLSFMTVKNRNVYCKWPYWEDLSGFFGSICKEFISRLLCTYFNIVNVRVPVNYVGGGRYYDSFGMWRTVSAIGL